MHCVDLFSTASGKHVLVSIHVDGRWPWLVGHAMAKLHHVASVCWYSVLACDLYVPQQCCQPIEEVVLSKAWQVTFHCNACSVDAQHQPQPVVLDATLCCKVLFQLLYCICYAGP